MKDHEHPFVICTPGGRPLRPKVPGLDAGGFDAAVDDAKALCPISRLFAGAKITVDAALE